MKLMEVLWTKLLKHSPNCLFILLQGCLQGSLSSQCKELQGWGRIFAYNLIRRNIFCTLASGIYPVLRITALIIVQVLVQQQLIRSYFIVKVLFMQSVLGDTLQETSRHSGSYNLSAPLLRHSLSHRYMSRLRT